MPFALFLGALAGYVDRLVVAGRARESPQPAPYRLPADAEFVAMPWWEDLGQPAALLRAAPAALRRFWRLLDTVDAVWLFGPSPLAMAFALLARVRRRGVVLGVRMDYPRYVRGRRPGQRRLHCLADVLDLGWRVLARAFPVVVVGADLARRYARTPALLPAAISLVPARDVLTADSVRRRAYDENLRVLSVGRLDAEKNPLLLADVLAHLRASDRRWRLSVCGDGALADALAHRLRELGVSDHAELLGHVPAGDQLRDLYRASHAFLHVSWTEGVPQVLYEAFAAGLPVVATDVGGVASAAADAALLVPAGDVDAPVAALHRIADDPDERRRLSERGLQLAADHTREAEGARIVSFIEREVGSASRSTVGG